MFRKGCYHPVCLLTNVSRLYIIHQISKLHHHPQGIITAQRCYTVEQKQENCETEREKKEEEKKKEINLASGGCRLQTW